MKRTSRLLTILLKSHYQVIPNVVPEYYYPVIMVVKVRMVIDLDSD